MKNNYEKVKRKFKWLAKEDNDWVEFDEIVEKVYALVATSRSGQMFTFQKMFLIFLTAEMHFQVLYLYWVVNMRLQ